MRAVVKAEIFFLIIILAFAAFLRYVDPIYLSALPVTPDSVEYTMLAYNLLRGEGFHIVINDAAYPPRYPYGYPLLLLPFIAVTGALLHKAVYASLFFGVALAFVTYLFTRSAFGPAAGLLAAVLVAVSPLCVTFSRIILAVSASATLALLTLFFSWRLLVRDGEGARYSLCWLGVGLLAGFNTSVQLISALFILPVAVAILVTRKEGRAGALGGLALGFGLAIAPLLVYFKLAYGSVFITGYKYWVPEFYGQLSDSFSASYIFANQRCSEDGRGTGNLLYYGGYLLGRGSDASGNPYPPPFLVFVAVGIGRLILDAGGRARGSRAFLILSGSAFLFLGAFIAIYCFQMAKFLLFAVPLIIITGAYGVAASWRLVTAREWRRRLPGVLLLLLVIPLIRDIGGFVADTGLRQRHPPWVLQPFESVQAVNRVAEDDAAIISSMDGVYVTHYAVSGTGRTYIPMTRSAEYISKRDLPLVVAEEDPDAIESILSSGRSVYVDGFTARGWPGQMMQLGRRFNIKSVATYHGGALHVYKIELRKP